MAMGKFQSTNVGNVKQQVDPNASVEFFPIFGKVVIEVDDSTERVYGSLILPLQDVSRQSIGRIIATYATETLPNGDVVSSQVSVGDIVLFGQYTGTNVRLAGKTYVICKEQDLLSIVYFSAPISPVDVEAF